jgi:hypothetical protein
MKTTTPLPRLLRLDRALTQRFRWFTDPLGALCFSPSGAVYETTETACTCPDHRFRHHECKHMLALRLKR